MNDIPKKPQPKVRKGTAARATQAHESKKKYKRRKLRVEDAEDPKRRD